MSLRRSPQVAIAPAPTLEIGTSFSFGSDDGEEGSDERPIMQSKSKSFRLVIKKENRSSDQQTGGESFDKRVRSMPLTVREKLRKGNASMDKKALLGGSGKTKKGDTGLREDMGMIKDAFFSNSWRAKNVQKKNFLKNTDKTNNSIPKLTIDESTSRDDENESALDSGNVLTNMFGALVSTFDGSLREGNESQNSKKGYGSDANASPSLRTQTTSAVAEKFSSEKEFRKLFVSTSEAVLAGKWHIVNKNIENVVGLLGFQCSKNEKKNLIHIIASQKEVPGEIMDVLIHYESGGIRQADMHGCIPLHYAASVGRDVNCLQSLVAAWPFGASARNVDGDLPLHVAVWAGQGNEENAKSILKAYPAALITGNDVGGIPLHLASCGENASAEIVKILLEKHDELEYPIGSIDVSGNAPVHIAIKTRAPANVLQSFKSVFGNDPFYKVDADDRSALQIALTMKDIDPSIVFFLSYAAPLTAKSPLPKTAGIMPAVYAAQKGMPDYVVKQLLLSDMPIHFLQHDRTELAPVILRTHRFSWWHIATKFPKYASVLDDILANQASLHETVALAQETDTEGYGCLYESAVGHVKNSFKNNLVFGDRYEVIAMFRAIVQDSLLKVCALDWGDRIAWEEIGENEEVSSLEEDAYAITRAKSSDGNEIEVVYNTHTKVQREVALHCCVKDSDACHDLMDEMEARRKTHFDRDMCQRLFNVHTFDAKKIGCVGEMLCVSFERPLLTLQDVFDTSRFRRRKNQAWARKSWSLLKRLAQVLDYFHSVGYVYGHVETATIAKFNGSNNWKLTDMRYTTKIGSPMSGGLRPGAPPESISSSSLVLSPSSDRLTAISFDEDFNRTKTINYSVSLDEEGPSLSFAPEHCVADPSWDIYSFGLVMGQLILGQSMVLLPNFEKAEDAHLKNLNHFGYDRLLKIQATARKVTGRKASTLLSKCLQPAPEDRPRSMSEILQDPYFDDINSVTS